MCINIIKEKVKNFINKFTLNIQYLYLVVQLYKVLVIIKAYIIWFHNYIIYIIRILK